MTPRAGWSDRTIRDTTRRTFLRSTAAVAGLAAVPTIGAADRVWLSAETPVDVTLHDVELAGETGLTVGGGGAVYRRDAEGWTQEATPSGSNLNAVVDADGIEVGGGAGGTVLQR